MLYYTGIGSRETPDEIQQAMTKIATILSGANYILRSGGADGADKAFENGAKLKEIYIPWRGFNGSTSTLIKGEDATARRIASTIHPAWHRCTEPARKLHTRNIFQVLGADLNIKSQFVICWTSDGKPSGGTATAMNLAMNNNIPVFNMYYTNAIEMLQNLINIRLI